jgi:putative membrane protein
MLRKQKQLPVAETQQARGELRRHADFPRRVRHGFRKRPEGAARCRSSCRNGSSLLLLVHELKDTFLATDAAPSTLENQEVLMHRFLVMLALVTAGPCLAADPATRQASAPVAPTATFVASAAFGNMFEIESSKLALERSKSGAVKAFAQRMVDDHSAAAVKFKEAVLDSKLTMPPDKLDARRQALMAELAGKQDADFDKAYIDAQFEAHVETVDLFKGYAQGGEDSRMRAFAADLLPALEAHLEHVSKMR